MYTHIHIKQLLLFAFMWFIVSSISAQEIERKVISSTSNESSNGTVIISSTVGEPAVQTKTDGTVFITEGFQQPVLIVLASVNLKFYNGITPNNDGINDTWIIDGISQYSENDITIFGRAGNEVWSGNGYDNTSVVFEGINKSGAPLPSGTYYYIMNIPAAGKIPSGWIQITR